MLLARECKLPAEAIRQVGMGALFHDIRRRLRMPSQITAQDGAAHQAQAEPDGPASPLRPGTAGLVSDFPGAAKQIVQNHRRYLDGTGPRGSGAISSIPSPRSSPHPSRYDSLCHLGPGALRGPRQPLQTAPARLAPMPRHALIRLMGSTPPGSVVQLSSGQVGLVMSVNASRLPAPCWYTPDSRARGGGHHRPRRGRADHRQGDPPQTPAPAVFRYLNPHARISYYFEHGKALI